MGYSRDGDGKYNGDGYSQDGYNQDNYDRTEGTNNGYGADEYDSDDEEKNKKEKSSNEDVANKYNEQTKSLLLSQGFEFVRQLKPAGVSGGSLDLYRYTGDDPSIKALLDDKGQLLLKTEIDAAEAQKEIKKLEEKVTTYNKAIKDAPQDQHQVRETFARLLKEAKEDLAEKKSKLQHGIATFSNEYENINQMLSQQNNDSHLKRPKLLTIEADERRFIFNECIYQDPVEKKAQNMEGYVAELGALVGQFSESIKDEAIDDVQLKSIQARMAASSAKLDTIYASMMEAQDQLHDHHMLHLDTAGRNYCMLPDGKVKVIDFGASLAMNEEGRSVKPMPYNLVPTAYFNQEALPVKGSIPVASISTDYFARRITMMESMAVFLGMNNDERQIDNGIHFQGLPVGNGENIVKALKKIDDETRLNNSFANLMTVAQEMARNQDIRGQVIVNQLKAYENYLTHMPKSETLAAFRQQEKTLYSNAMQYQQLIGVLNDNQKLEKVLSDPAAFRKLYNQAKSHVTECQRLGVPEKISQIPGHGVLMEKVNSLSTMREMESNKPISAANEESHQISNPQKR